MTTTMKAKISERRSALRVDGVEVERRQHAGERGGDTTDREDERERLAHVDPERGHHRPVLDAGADDQPVARAAQERLERDEHDHRGGDLDPAVVRDVRAEDVVVLPDHGGQRDELRRRSPRSRSRAR